MENKLKSKSNHLPPFFVEHMAGGEQKKGGGEQKKAGGGGKKKEVKKETGLGLSFTKDENFGEWYSEVVVNGEMIEYYDISGCYILRPWAMSIWENIQTFFDAKIKKMKVKNCYFPLFVSPGVLQKEKDHIEGFAPEVAWVTKSGESDLEVPIALRPTSETVMYPYYSKWIRGHRDLPLKLNQWCNVVRWEFSNPTPFIRSREFLWQEGHTAFATKEEADTEVLQILELYRRIYEEFLAIPVTKGRKSELEKFAGGLYTTSVEAFIPNTGRGIQGATSHCLGQNFAKMFEINFENEKGEKSMVWQNSWAYSTRTIGVMVMVHGDNKGLVLPPKVAALQVIVIPVPYKDADTQGIFDACAATVAILSDAGIRAEADLRENYSPGWKYSNWEMKGVPLRIEIGPRDLANNQVRAVRRDNGEKTDISRVFLVEQVKGMLEKIQQNLFDVAKQKRDACIEVVKTWDEFIKALGQKKLILAPWCDEEEVEKDVKARTKGEMGAAKSLCTPFERAPLLLHSFTLPTTKITLVFRSVSTPLNETALSLNTTTPNTIPFLPSPFLRCRAAMTTAACVQVKEQIELTETEKKIFDRLLNTLRHFNLQTQLRVAGGWVRDKLLGKECYDIDIALDNMLGSEFVDKVQEYLSTTGEVAQGLAVIPSNPEQSKHLETARMRLFDLWIDFVNLRCEDYSENSRIPTMKFGTAEEDAYRRDLTINSLFYNINTNLVEDFTKRGLEDLKFGRIVTPLPPKATFLDDPLRVLRAIRFGARFDFTLDEELKKAAACDDVKTALAAKISRERIGTEIDLMISGNQPVKAIDYICDLTLFWVVFSFPPKVEPAVSEECYRLSAAYLDASWKLIQLIGCSNFDDEQRRLCLYSALFLPLRSAAYKDRKDKKIPVVNYIFRDSLKRKASDADTVMNIHKSLEKFLSLITSLLSNEDIQLTEVDWGREFDDVPFTSKLRVLTGFLLREIKDFWRVALLISTLLYPTGTECSQDIIDKHFQLDKRKNIFVSVDNAIVKLGLEKVWDLKPLVNGKDIMNVLQLKVGGPLVREWQQKALSWQLAHPSGTAEECLDWMKETHSKRIKME